MGRNMIHDLPSERASIRQTTYIGRLFKAGSALNGPATNNSTGGDERHRQPQHLPVRLVVLAKTSCLPALASRGLELTIQMDAPVFPL